MTENKMEIVADSELNPGHYKGSTVAVGNFDGVHLGHRALVGAVRERAASLGGPAVVYTFDPHPLKVLNPSAAPQNLTDFDQKAELLGELGVDVLVRARFDHEYAAREPAWFAEWVLKELLDAREVWIGPDFAFGRNRTGNRETLLKTGAKLGYEVRNQPAETVDGERVSSTRVRKAIADRDFTLAAKLLGRPYAVHGPIVHGVGRGKMLGFPTANVLPREECLPPLGVYAALAHLEGEEAALGAAVNIGPNPTFGSAPVTVEAHLLDRGGDLYGRDVRLSFVSAIRGEIAFASVDALVSQIARDVEKVRGVLAGAAG